MSIALPVGVDRVLCAVEFSPSARQVVAWAASLAESNDAEVQLFHALPRSEEAAFAASEADFERVLKNLFALAQPLPGRPRISAAVAEGEADSEILRQARLVKADLIAVGMQAEDGSVSPVVARLAVDAPCPILVVDENAAVPTSGNGLNHILVAVDFRPAALAAADQALGLAAASGAQVTVVHVLPEQWEGPQRHDQNIDEIRRYLEHHCRGLIQIAVSAASGVKRDHSVVVASGRPCVEIVRLATARDADLIVMGIDVPAKAAAGFGETTSCVMQFAGKSVLLVPERSSRLPRFVSSSRPH